MKQQTQEFSAKNKMPRMSRMAAKQKHQRPEETKKERMYH